MNKKQMSETQLEEYWNSKHPKTEIVYGGRAVPNHTEIISIDVRKFIWVDDCNVSDFVDKQNISNLSNDDKVLYWQKWVVNNIKYVSDISQFNYNEYWGFVPETLLFRAGDCEEFSTLITTLSIYSGVQTWRVRSNAGWVLSPSGNLEGHCYTTYCRFCDNNWVIIDGCYYPDPDIMIKDKPLAKNNSNYKDLWFSFNNLFSFSHKNYDLFEDINQEPKMIV